MGKQKAVGNCSGPHPVADSTLGITSSVVWVQPPLQDAHRNLWPMASWAVRKKSWMLREAGGDFVLCCCICRKGNQQLAITCGQEDLSSIDTHTHTHTHFTSYPNLSLTTVPQRTETGGKMSSLLLCYIWLFIPKLGFRMEHGKCWWVPSPPKAEPLKDGRRCFSLPQGGERHFNKMFMSSTDLWVGVAFACFWS